MAMATDSVEDLDLAEKLTRIVQMQADALRKQQEVRLAPWQLVISALLAGAALMGGSVALLGYLNGLH